MSKKSKEKNKSKPGGDMLRGKDLKVGMSVLLVQAHQRCRLGAGSGVPMKLIALSYPMAIFECIAPPPPVVAQRILNLPDREQKHTHGLDVRGSRFVIATAEYLAAYNNSALTPDEDWKLGGASAVEMSGRLDGADGVKVFFHEPGGFSEFGTSTGPDSHSEPGASREGGMQ